MLALTRPYNVLEDIHHYCEKVSNNPISEPIKNSLHFESMQKYVGFTSWLFHNFIQLLKTTIFMRIIKFLSKLMYKNEFVQNKPWNAISKQDFLNHCTQRPKSYTVLIFLSAIGIKFRQAYEILLQCSRIFYVNF